jgi:hypothetical protein
MLFDSAGFSRQQKRCLASTWHNWCADRKELDSKMQKACKRLQELPEMSVLSSEALDFIDHLADGAASVATSSMRDDAEGRSISTQSSDIFPDLTSLSRVVMVSEQLTTACLAIDELHEIQDEAIRRETEVIFSLMLPSSGLPNSIFFKLAFSQGRMAVDRLQLCSAAADEERHCSLFSGAPLSIALPQSSRKSL